MLLLLKLAARNLLRNRRRTIITTLAISMGLGLMIATNNFAYGSYVDMIHTGVSTLAGHVVVQGKGYQAERDKTITVHDATEVSKKLRGLFPTAVVVPRTFLDGLLSSPTNSVGIAVTAIDPTWERKVSDWQDKVVEGDFLSPVDAPDADREILLGKGLADTLQVGLGDKVVLMSQGSASHGSEVDSRLFRVKGVLSTGSKQLDGFAAVVDLPAAQALLGQPDQVSQLSVHLPDPDQATEATAKARGALGPDLEVLDWPHALPEMYESIHLDASSSNVMMSVIGLIVAIGVLNTVLMSVMERVREFGVMMALGVPRSRVATLIVMEGAVLGVVAVALGIGVGMLITWPLVVHGVDYSQMMGESMDFGGVSMKAVMRAAIDWHRLIIFSIAGVFVTIAATFYPAFKASRLKPVDAIHHL